jgi:hypothetical protein
MQSVVQRVIVVGGNGYIGLFKHHTSRILMSTTCRLRNMQGCTRTRHAGNKHQLVRSAICHSQRPHALLGVQGLSISLYVTVPNNADLQVSWEKGDALRPSTYAHLLAGAHGVAHTLGTLLPGGGYKEKLRSGNYLGLVSELARSASGGKLGGPNPLDESIQDKSYERINRDTGVCYIFGSDIALNVVYSCRYVRDVCLL